MAKHNEKLPANYYDKRARQRISPTLHYVGRTLMQKFINIEQGSDLEVLGEVNVEEVVRSKTPVLIAATHRSSFDIPFFVTATERAGLHHVRPLSKIENVQIHPVVSGFFHRVGLFAADRDNPDLDGIDLVFKTAKARGQHTLVFPEGKRVKKDVDVVQDYARTPAMMAIKHGFPVVSLAIVGASVDETKDSRHSFRGRTLQVPDCPVALFGEVMNFEHQPDIDERSLVRAAGKLTREVLKPDLQQTLSDAIVIRRHFMNV